MSRNRESDVDNFGSILEKIGLTVADLSSSDGGAGEISEALECLRLWFAIRTDAGRRRALEGLSRILEDEQR